MARRLILGSYAVAGGCILASNKTTYKPKDKIAQTYWDLLKRNTDYGKTTSTVFFIFSPALLPAFTLTLPLLKAMRSISD